jgi:hypothetical protein
MTKRQQVTDVVLDLLDVVANVAAIDEGWLKAAHPTLLRKAIAEIRAEARAAMDSISNLERPS